MKNFNPLIDEPPRVAEIGPGYPANTDFSIVLAYIRLLKSDEPDEEKIKYALVLFFGPMIAPNDAPALVEWIQWFVRCGEEAQEQPKKKRVFDLLIDSGRVYAAFMQAYRINLRSRRIHWWLFCELLEGLPKSTHLSEVIELRGREPEKWMKPADRLELARRQKVYALEQDDGDPIASVFNSLLMVAQNVGI